MITPNSAPHKGWTCPCSLGASLPTLCRMRMDLMSTSRSQYSITLPRMLGMDLRMSRGENG